MSFCQTKTDAVKEDKPIDDIAKIELEYEKSI